ncbi:hypothetical protein AAK706_11020 [Erysipelotrichaceae bacterium 66-17]|uniref:hypothetical protein n=2 Tax=uncultured Dubosiella sp. TaxID=1937011 RepID=UPI0026210F11|nr:hypothetical protein [uncultured Dubosiella sp.]
MKNKITKLMLLGVLLTGCSTAQIDSEEKNDSSSEESSYPKATEIKKADDKYTYYIKDYKGMNVSQVGSWNGDECIDKYYAGSTPFYIPFIFYTENGEAVDENNEKDFYVVKQDPAPNTEEKVTYFKKEDGTEYDDSIDRSSIEPIKLYVKPVEKK